MKIGSDDESFLKLATNLKGVRAVLVYGPNRGLVKERADALTMAVLKEKELDEWRKNNP